MNGESSTGSVFDLRGIMVGTGWGLGLLLLAGLIQGAVGHGSPISAGLEQILAMLWQALGVTLGGFVAGRRAPVAGWLHGALAGLCFILAVTVVMGVLAALPTMTALLKMGAIGLGLGAAAGAAGVATR